MKRRNFLKTATAMAMLAPLRSWAQSAKDQLESVGIRGGGNVEGVDPYFLSSGEVPPAEQDQISEYMGYLENASEGKDAIIPRGGRPKHAPTYRFLRWKGEIGDPFGRFVGPLSTKPVSLRGNTYQLNAQILGFHTASEDWPGKYNVGTLSVEIRARIRGESMTWLYAQQFELFEGGTSSLGMEYIAQRDGVPAPVATDEENIDLRIQLMRNQQEKGGVLGTVFKVASVLTGGTLGGVAGVAASLAPPVRIPQMVQEGVAFSQAVFGGTSDEQPLWRSGFTSYAITQGGGRFGLLPGLWLAMDESRQVDLRGSYLEDLGGRVALLKDGEELDVNYLILALEIEEGPLPDLYYAEPPAESDFPDEWESEPDSAEDPFESERDIRKRDGKKK